VVRTLSNRQIDPLTGRNQNRACLVVRHRLGRNDPGRYACIAVQLQRFFVDARGDASIASGLGLRNHALTPDRIVRSELPQYPFSIICA
jgi:hypothetical protein